MHEQMVQSTNKRESLECFCEWIFFASIETFRHDPRYEYNEN